MRSTAAIIGTAGHIDHGKTALVRALTGQETDRLPAEKERGISIELGFAHYEVAGRRFGVIDVPGHERFIRHMLAGAHGVDLVLLVVAADDGIMPQTEEHFDILHLLGVTSAIVVITKSDLVSPERLAEVRGDVEVLTCDTAFERAPVLAVSSTTGAGLEELRREIARQLDALPERASRGYFRLPIDRVFSMHGHGLVATGTAIAGVVREGDTIAIRPGELTARARAIQVHGTGVVEASVGQRIAVNLSGPSRDEVRRGQWLTDPRIERCTDRFDCWLEVRSGGRAPIRTFDRVRVHLGTAEVMGRVVLLGERREIAPKAGAYCQVALEEPVLAAAGDRFIVRSETATRTSGGGTVVQPFAIRHRSDEAGLEKHLERLLRGTLSERVHAVLATLHELAATPALLAQALSRTEEEVLAAALDSAEVVALPSAEAVEILTTREKWSRLADLVREALAQFHRVHPLEAGMEIESLRSRLRVSMPPRQFRPAVDRLETEGVLARDEAIVHLPQHAVTLERGDADVAARVREALAAGGFTPPDRRQLAQDLSLTGAQLQQILAVLERSGEVVRVSPDLYYDSAALGRIRAAITIHLGKHGTITVAELRDMLSASRKYTLPLLEYFDSVALTIRTGDARRLRRAS